jgi:hypothetical protein
MSNLTSICGTPLLAGTIPSRWKIPSLLVLIYSFKLQELKKELKRKISPARSA